MQLLLYTTQLHIDICARTIKVTTVLCIYNRETEGYMLTEALEVKRSMDLYWEKC